MQIFKQVLLYLSVGYVWELLKEKQPFFSSFVQSLALKNAGGRHCGQTHAITHEQNDILGALLDWLPVQSTRQFVLANPNPVGGI